MWQDCDESHRFAVDRLLMRPTHGRQAGAGDNKRTNHFQGIPREPVIRRVTPAATTHQPAHQHTRPAKLILTVIRGLLRKSGVPRGLHDNFAAACEGLIGGEAAVIVEGLFRHRASVAFPRTFGPGRESPRCGKMIDKTSMRTTWRLEGTRTTDGSDIGRLGLPVLVF